jgi:hypothetical protein
MLPMINGIAENAFNGLRYNTANSDLLSPV